MELPYLKVVLVAFACLGVHLVEPFYARTIEKDATHTRSWSSTKDCIQAWGSQSRQLHNVHNT
ncbi:Hypothetical protein FKW44_005336 [Caligus rogercresseyi]|uniref:Uncharacterized protein n=1 Tax=Caligus rogercresseyi TaxID=217165 RepID=A0A7T8QRX5_CALRO|nr:Hypothetical protein FKW44_005336 [Caligus rogercresseyi]